MRSTMADSGLCRLSGVLVHVVFVVCLILNGCAARPGPDVLTPVAGAPGTKIVTIYVATNRMRDPRHPEVFTSGRSLSLSFARFKISIPPNHKVAEIEWPRSRANSAHDFAVLERKDLNEADFRREVEDAGRWSAADHMREIGVFVHGFNNNFQESLYRYAELLVDAKNNTSGVLFAWPSEASFYGYAADRDAVTLSRDPLVKLLGMMSSDEPAGRITLFGHSMGAWLVMEAVRQLRLTGQTDVLDRLRVILAAPDIDLDVFRSQLDAIGRLSLPLVMLVSKKDLALKISAYLSGNRERAGSVDLQTPGLKQAAVQYDVKVIDISSLRSPDGTRHNIYETMAGLNATLKSLKMPDILADLSKPGAFQINQIVPKAAEK